ncbi:MAG: 2,3-diphosphoglycerate synthetase [Methanobacteriaceae archaeon]
MSSLERMVCLVDGEHYLPVTKSAIDVLGELEHIDIVAIVFIGGTEKLRVDDSDLYSRELGAPVYFAEDKSQIPYDLIEDIAMEYKADVVMDLSDEPVLDYTKRLKIASTVLSLGITYKGPDFEFNPLTQYDVLKNPSLKILGTGKRIGKTAVSAYAARLIDENGYNPCVVAMGRGGPKEPEIVYGNELEITPEFLMKQSEKGVHAASDHWEDALMSRVLTVGCRRCGGGMIGDAFVTNVKKGAELTNDLDTDFVIMEGSGAALPPIKTDKSILLIGANQPLINIENFFGPFRIKLADMVVLTMCEEPMASKEKVDKIEKIINELNPNAVFIPTVFRPKPLGDISGKNVLFATTAPESVKGVLVKHLEEEYNCNVVGTTPHLSNRPLLQKDISKYMGEVNVMLTELKAAAVDVATKDSLEAGLEVVYCDNIPIELEGNYADLSKSILDIVEDAIGDFNK